MAIYSSEEHFFEHMTYKEKCVLLHYLFDGKDEEGRPYGIYASKVGKYKTARVNYDIHAKIGDGDFGGLLYLNSEFSKKEVEVVGLDEESYETLDPGL